MSRSSVSALLANCVAPLRSHLCARTSALCALHLWLCCSPPRLSSRGAETWLMGAEEPLGSSPRSRRCTTRCLRVSTGSALISHVMMLVWVILMEIHGTVGDGASISMCIHQHLTCTAAFISRGSKHKVLRPSHPLVKEVYLWQVCGSEEADLTAHLRALGAQHVHVGTCHAQHACGPSCKGRRQAIRICWRPQRLTTATQFTVRACDGATT